MPILGDPSVFVFALKACPHFRNFRGAVALFQHLNLLLAQATVTVWNQLVLSLGLYWSNKKHSLAAHRWVFILRSPLCWAFTSVNVTAGTLWLIHVLTRMESGKKRQFWLQWKKKLVTQTSPWWPHHGSCAQNQIVLAWLVVIVINLAAVVSVTG